MTVVKVLRFDGQEIQR